MFEILEAIEVAIVGLLAILRLRQIQLSSRKIDTS